MSQENVVRLVYRAWSDGDLDALLAVCDAGVELRTSGAFPDVAPVYRGHDGSCTVRYRARSAWTLKPDARRASAPWCARNGQGLEGRVGWTAPPVEGCRADGCTVPT